MSPTFGMLDAGAVFFSFSCSCANSEVAVMPASVPASNPAPRIFRNLCAIYPPSVDLAHYLFHSQVNVEANQYLPGNVSHLRKPPVKQYISVRTLYRTCLTADEHCYPERHFLRRRRAQSRSHHAASPSRGVAAYLLPGIWLQCRPHCPRSAGMGH